MKDKSIDINLETQNASESLRQNGIFRYGLTLPLAAVATVGLTLSMGTLIAAEFTPQDKAETAVFEINTDVEEIPIHTREVKLDPLKEVEIPPAPPVIDTIKTAEVIVPVKDYVGRKPMINLDDLDINQKTVEIRIDKELSPIRRFPPVFPRRFSQGNVSGYCQVQYDINPEGDPYNVSTTFCTDDQLSGPTIKSVKKWKYAPQISKGRAVSRSALQTTIRFDLQDEKGRLLPMPAGY